MIPFPTDRDQPSLLFVPLHKYSHLVFMRVDHLLAGHNSLAGALLPLAEGAGRRPFSALVSELDLCVELVDLFKR